MICPVCDFRGNLPGADWCESCQFDLASIDRPVPFDRVEKSLMHHTVRMLEPKRAVVVGPQTPLRDAARLMIEKKVGALLVVSMTEQLIGILTERDYLTKVAGTGQDDLPVDLFMTRDPDTVSQEDTLAFVLSKMTTGNYRHVPVLNQGRAVGMISVRDILRHLGTLCQE